VNRLAPKKVKVGRSVEHEVKDPLGQKLCSLNLTEGLEQVNYPIGLQQPEFLT
jgi:hypothetical protein